MTNRFELRKQNILAQLGAPDGEYHDLSPKGSVDEPIRELINEINRLTGLVTTSSCSGRISVFLEGRKTNSADVNDESGDPRAGPGGKGGGGAWLYISHASIETPQANEPAALSARFGLAESTSHDSKAPGVDSRYIHLKFEPMVSSMQATTGYALIVADSPHLDGIYNECTTCSHSRFECWASRKRRGGPRCSQKWRDVSHGSSSINRLFI